MTPPSAHDAEALLAHTGWVRRLAHGLVDDPHLADDLAQEAMVVALERRPRDGGPIGGWLAGVVRNLAFKARRTSVRRQRRERSSARAEAQPGADELLERAQLHRIVVEAVTHLREPYRTAVLLRYLEELPPRAIAKRTGVPVSTVNTRLARGLAELRERLDRESGDRRNWLPGLLAWCGASRSLEVTGLGALLVNTKLKAGLVAGVVLVSIAGLYVGLRGGPEGSSGAENKAVVASPPSTPVDVGEPEVVASNDAPERAPALTPGEPAAAAPAPAPGETVLRVLVVDDETLAPLANVYASATPARAPDRNLAHAEGARGSFDEFVVTGADGLAEFVVPPHEDVALRVRGANWNAGHSEVAVPELDAGEMRELTVELPAGADLHFFGRVVEAETGAAIAGARVAVDDVATWNARRGGCDVATDGIADALTRSDGTFDLWIPKWKPGLGRVSAEGYASNLFGLGAGHERSDEPQLVKLARAATLTVEVIDEAGAPAGDLACRVTTEAFRLIGEQGMWLLAWKPDPSWTQAMDGGRTRFSQLPVDVPLVVEVSQNGQTLQRVALLDGELITLKAGESRRIELRTGSDRELLGILVDETGAPLADVPMWVLKATAPVAHHFAAHEREAVSATAVTAADGRFRMQGLGDGSWWVGPRPGPGLMGVGDSPDAEAIAPVAVSVAVPADLGTEIVVRTQRGLYIRGRVTDGQGAPVRMAIVLARADGVSGAAMHRTDQDGSFAIGPLAPGLHYLTATHQGNNSETVQVEAGAESVVLALGAAGSISGRFVFANDAEDVGGLVVLFAPQGRPAGPRDLKYLQYRNAREYQRPGLTPGIYEVTARTDTGEVAVRRDVEVHAGEDTGGVDLAFEPGARLQITFEGGADWAMLRVRHGATLVAADNIGVGTPSAQTVPAGELEVILRAPDGREVKKTIELRAGEREELTLRFDG